MRLILIVIILLIASCSKQTKKEEYLFETIKAKDNTEANREEKGWESLGIKKANIAVKELLSQIKDINFEFDRSNFSFRGIQQAYISAEILLEIIDRYDLKISVTLEGHCDNRGSGEYNLALGSSRALLVYKYLISSGFNSSEVNYITYGEERPLIKEDTEQGWAANRRVHILVNIH